MPELPEVEVSRLGITPWMEGVVVEKVVIRHPRLRWPIPSEIHLLEGQPLHSIERRAKYLLLRSTLGTAILHLGMSGHLRILPIGTPAEKHDHVDLELANGKLLRFHDRGLGSNGTKNQRKKNIHTFHRIALKSSGTETYASKRHHSEWMYCPIGLRLDFVAVEALLLQLLPVQQMNIFLTY